MDEKEKARIRAREWYENNKERAKENARIRRENKTTEQILKEKEYHKQYRAENAERIKLQRKEKHKQFPILKKIQDIKYNYGINEEQFKKFFVDQNEKCGICEKKWDSLIDSDICVDHCHKSGKVRGLLCKLCNMALGNIGTLQNHHNLLGYHNKHKGINDGSEQSHDSARKAEIV